MNETEVKYAKKSKKYIEAKVVIEPHNSLFSRNSLFYTGLSESEINKKEIEAYRRWADELREFFRDHRSQDVNDVYVDVVEEDVCNICGETWETTTDVDNKTIICANCGNPVAK